MSRTRPAIAARPPTSTDPASDRLTLGLDAPLDRPEPRVDNQPRSSVPFAPPAQGGPGAASNRSAPRPVGPGRPPIVAVAAAPRSDGWAMAEYPIQLAKIQPPPLREDTLARDRLLEWLKVRIHRRLILVVAEAGYGKTTLLADFSRRTRVRTLWYRLDRGDRDWVPFLAHLVAAVRAFVPGFGPATDGLIRETGTTAPPLAMVLDTFLRELGSVPPEPLAVILDDYHLVEDSQDIVRVARELVARAPERISFVVISRQSPSLATARLRTLGEVAELHTDDLRFDTAETGRLFREAYALRLDDALVAELSMRTEGWAASLQLVRTAIRDRTPTERRAFIHSISGAEGELYDYLAEEVVGDQPPELQQFLMRTSLLETVDPELGAVAAGISQTATRSHIDAGEALGLFGRRGSQGRFQVRAHPLVRDFLQERLHRSIGPDQVRSIHRAVAKVAEARDWRIAGHHYAAAGDVADARRVLASALESILATGAYAAAEELARRLPDDGVEDSSVSVIESRVALQDGAAERSVRAAQEAVDRSPDSEIARWNRLMIRVSAGQLDTLETDVEDILRASVSSIRTLTATAVLAAIRTSVEGNLEEAAELFVRCANEARRRDFPHFLGVALVNLAQVRRVQGLAPQALEAADEAVAVLGSISSRVEIATAHLARAWALAHLGDLSSAREAYAEATTDPARPLEVAFEAADIEALYGDSDRGWSILGQVAHLIDPGDDVGEQALVTQGSLQLRMGQVDDARAVCKLLRLGKASTGIGFEARRRAFIAEMALATSEQDWRETSAAAIRCAETQGAGLFVAAGRLLAALGVLGADAHLIVPCEGTNARRAMSIHADLVAKRLDSLSEPVFQTVSEETLVLPERWREPLRATLASGSKRARQRAAPLLETIGVQSDVAVLRRAARTGRVAPESGRALARRLAPKAWIRDLGSVTVVIGEHEIEGTSLRRKVLALLCYLLTKPAMRAAREEVVDALWPDSDPDAALNSLNQTTYYLRRVFEPDYAEDLSPGYVVQTTETIWLDGELIDSAGRACWRLVRAARGAVDTDAVDVLGKLYTGRFAADFQYEDWATAYGETLHAAYLHVLETAVRRGVDGGEVARGLSLARMATDVEPESEDIQVSLVRLYRLAGSHSAAAEQYAQYARLMRDLGLDPSPFEDL